MVLYPGVPRVGLDFLYVSQYAQCFTYEESSMKAATQPAVGRLFQRTLYEIWKVDT